MRILALAVVLAALMGSAWSADKDELAFWKENLPKGLVDAKGNAVTVDQLKGKIVGIYFSAHWCPPCKVFTPKLVEFRDKNAKEFEVVFVSSDHTEKEQQGYMAEAKMQWPAVKWRAEEGNALMKKYKVTGIPKLVILAPDGTTLSENGRGDVTSNPDTCLDGWKKAASK
ncbi:MAG: redoxin family protein [Planctomycetota bacterium]|nr:redoxin family protein [Planctomycetota bacterium]